MHKKLFSPLLIATLVCLTALTWPYFSIADNTSSEDATTSAAISGKIASIVSGKYHSLAVLTDGTVRAWGNNTYGQLGNGTKTSSKTPVTVKGLTDIASSVGKAAAGLGHSLAVSKKGVVYSWGLNDKGQLGNGTKTNSPLAAALTKISGVNKVSAGNLHSLAITITSKLGYSWGANSKNQLGVFSSLFTSQLGKIAGTDSDSPENITSLSNVEDIVGGENHSLALLSTGSVWSWGDNTYSQLGDRFNPDSDMPDAVIGISDATAIASGNNHSLVLYSNGTVGAWGNNSDGQLGNGSNTNSSTPVAVSGISGATAIAGGDNFSAVLLSNGTVKAWGDNDNGQLGNGTTTDSNTPVTVVGLDNVSQISVGADHFVALLTDGTVTAWGNNTDGQLGNGTNTSSSTPVVVKGADGSASLSFSAKPSKVKSGKKATLSGKLTDSQKNGVSGKKITIKRKVLKKSKKKAKGKATAKWTWKTVKTVKTDKNGKFKIQLSLKEATTYQAVFAGDSTYNKASSKSLTIKVKK